MDPFFSAWLPFTLKRSQVSGHCFTSNAIRFFQAELFIICFVFFSFFLLFNQGRDPMPRGLFSCKTRLCNPRPTIRIPYRLSRQLTNELCSCTNRPGRREYNTEIENEGRCGPDRLLQSCCCSLFRQREQTVLFPCN